ncbi:MAG: C1 family peptidase [Corynebacterium sp.]|nr:C1 family peptidase [Corynebacterium sp.]
MSIHTLNPTVVERLSDLATSDPYLTVTQNAVTSVDIATIGLDRERLVGLAGEPEIKLDRLTVTDQKSSGRCWMFAGFNAVRHTIAADLGAEEFELSQAYLHFYDKLEKAHYALTTLAAIRAGEVKSQACELTEDYCDRLISWLFQSSGDDGGMFSYYAALVAKYGAVPHSVMPDPHSATDTRAASAAVRTIVRRAWARNIPTDEALTDVHRVLAIHLGLPPQHFRFRYRDKEKNFHDLGEFTPREFAARFLDRELSEFMELAYDPRPGQEWGRAYTIEHVTNMVGSPTYRFVNAPMEVLHEAAVASMNAGVPVWFACDVSTDFSPLHMAWDRGLIATDELYGINTSQAAFSRSDQVSSRNLAPTHGMVFTGYDPASRIWRVENSWGTTAHKGEKLSGEGYGAMTSDWFTENVFSIVVPKRLVPAEYRSTWEDPHPRALPFFDPMF